MKYYKRFIKVSIVIVIWNSTKHLLRCLEFLNCQIFKEFEIIIVDNGSTDSGFEDSLKLFPLLKMQVEQLNENIGFAAANNIGAGLARGTWLALLNSDAFPKPDWLEHLLEAAETIPDAFFASRQIQENSPDLLDGEGDSYHLSGLAWRRNYGFPVKDKEKIEEIFSPCAAAALYPRQAFLEAGGFDEEYFSYQEDVDLGFRLRLNGLRCFYVPQAIVHHIGSASTGKQSDFSIYYGHRNLVWTYVKNMPTLLFWAFLPIHLIATLFVFLKFLFTGHARAFWKAKLDAIKGLRRMLRKRKSIQNTRKESAFGIYRVMEHDLFAPLFASIQRRRFEKYQK